MYCTCKFEGVKPLSKHKLILSKICGTNVSCTTFNDTLSEEKWGLVDGGWWQQAGGGARWWTICDSAETSHKVSSAGAGAGDTGMCNVSSIINHFSSDTLELLGLFLISCVVQQIFNNFPSIVVDHITAFSQQNGGFWFWHACCAAVAAQLIVLLNVSGVRRYKLSTCLYFSRGFCCTHCTRTWEK